MLLFTEITKKQYEEMENDRTIVKGRGEVKLSGDIVSIRLAKTYSSKLCESRRAAKKLFWEMVNHFGK